MLIKKQKLNKHLKYKVCSQSYDLKMNFENFDSLIPFVFSII
jgi:hypothetical protein